MQEINNENVVGLDFETYSDVSLPDCGLEAYVRSPHFMPLIATVARKDAWGVTHRKRLDFTRGRLESGKQELVRQTSGLLIAAHNAPFEKRVLNWMGIRHPAHTFIDTAVISRALGAGSRLAAAAPQLLMADKMEEGMDLIKLFSIPAEGAGPTWDETLPDQHPDKWKLFADYCDMDAELSLRLALEHGRSILPVEYEYAAITTRMNETGWPVDLDLVRIMQRNYAANCAEIEAYFRRDTGATELNLNSTSQLIKWCAERGVKATSFDEQHVASMLKKIKAKLDTMNREDPKFEGFTDVEHLLMTKQALGGTGLKKLQVILNQTTEDGRLRDQYLHCGAGQTLRSTGRGVQLQNLSRFDGDPDDVTPLLAGDMWSNDKLGANIRQNFCSSSPTGYLVVGDFSSVESRGLAYFAGAEWKRAAFIKGQDMYKVLAARIDGTLYENVTKDRRQFGKVGELSCGYQAGGDAVRDFAAKMGTVLTPAEAAKLVRDWRDTNPEIVDFWAMLDEMLRNALANPGNIQCRQLPYDGLEVYVIAEPAPTSLCKQDTRARWSLKVGIMQHSKGVLQRFFHGVYLKGNSLVYFKPSDNKTGDLWRDWYINPKTKQRQHYTIYGGKLAGILTQSFCREIFFRVLSDVNHWTRVAPSLDLIGQFHDEIVLDCVDGSKLGHVTQHLQDLMQSPGSFASFPLAAEVKYDYRYTK